LQIVYRPLFNTTFSGKGAIYFGSDPQNRNSVLQGETTPEGVGSLFYTNEGGTNRRYAVRCVCSYIHV
jgi:hypothetical protein